MSPRLTDWSIALATGIAFITGVVSLIAGHPQEWLVFVLHAVGGFWLLLLMWGKLRRVWPRVVRLRRWDRRTIFGLLALVLVMLALGSGIWWVTGGDVYFAGFNLLNWHILLGFVVSTAIVLHMVVRAKRLRTRDIIERRRAIQFSALLIGCVAVWPAEHRNESMETLDLLEQFTDEQLAAPLALSNLANMTAGNMFVANAQHAATHIGWIEEGFRQGLEGSEPAEEP